MKPEKDDNLEVLLKQFREAVDQTQEERDESERCRDYYDGKQWTDEETQALQKRGQPVIVSNRIAPKVNDRARNTMRYYRRQGRLKGVQIGRDMRYTLDELREFLSGKNGEQR